MATCVMILYTLVVLFYHQLPLLRKANRLGIAWEGKRHIIFSEMLANVRRYLYFEWIFAQAPGGDAVRKLSLPTQSLIEYGLTQAA